MMWKKLARILGCSLNLTGIVICWIWANRMSKTCQLITIMPMDCVLSHLDYYNWGSRKDSFVCRTMQ
jgi:hypothetical protein